MNQDRLTTARVLFDELADLPSSQRGELLRERCGDDSALRELVERLLKQHDKGLGKFLEQPLIAPEQVDASANDDLPTRIGAYTIVRKLGEGGMGIVYEARQENPRRTVALKLIRSGFVSANLLKRFEHEAQVLGQLQHPGIAQIYEAGVADVVMPGAVGASLAATASDRRLEQPVLTRQSFFAMEFVRGKILTQSASERGLGTRQKLELFVQLCDAVQYAHSRGIIHRDIKPGNILVDELGQPKVLDFGVARATNSDVQSLTLNTAIGQLVGTLPYMSPEQVSGDPTQIDVRADVYALGVTLYELLVGRLPFDLRNRSIPEAARIIREEDPTRLSSINPQLRGDIETIVAKAIEKERSRRYESVGELAADIRRYLSDEPVQARPASTWYQFRKFSRRNRGLVVGVSTTLVVLLVGIIVATTLALYALRQRDVAEQRNIEATYQAYRAGTAAALSGLQSGDTRLAQNHLDATPKELRDWEWHHLNWLIHGDSVTSTQTVGPNCVIRFSDDEHTMGTLDSEGQATIWDLLTLAVRRSFRVALHNAPTIVLDATGRRALIGALREGGVGVWDTTTGTQLWTRATASGTGAFSPDSSIVAILDEKSDQILVLDAATGAVRRSVAKGLTDCRGGYVQFSRSGKSIGVSAGPVHRVLELKTGRLVSEQVAWVFALTEELDRFVIFNPVAETICIGRAVDGLTLAKVPWNKGVLSVQWLPGDAGVYVRQPNGNAVVLDGVLREVRTYVADRDSLRTQTLRDPRKCVRILNDNRIQFQRTPAERTAFSIPHLLRFVGISADVARDGRMVVNGDWGYVRAYDTATARLSWCTLLKRRFVTQVAISPDGTLVAAIDRQNDFWRLRGDTGAIIGKPIRLDVPVRCLAWLGNSRDLVAGAETGELIFPEDGKPVNAFRRIKAHGGPVSCMAISPDGLSIATGADIPDNNKSGTQPTIDSSDPLLKIWDARTGAMSRGFEMHLPVRSICYSPDGKTLAVATSDKHVTLFHTADGSRAGVLRGMGEYITLAFNPSGTRLVTFADDGLVRVWDVSHCEEVLVMQGVRVVAAQFTPDGTSLIAAGPGAALQAFDSGTEHEVAGDRFFSLWAHRCLWDLRFEFVEDLVPKLKHDASIPSPVCDAAIQLAQTAGDHVGWLISDAISGMQNHATKPAELERIMRIARRAAQLMPEDCNAAMMYAEVLYYCKKFPQALVQVRATFDLFSMQGEPPSADGLAMGALCYHRTGNDAEAKRLMLQAEALAAKEPASVAASRSHFAEAKAEIQEKK